MIYNEIKAHPVEQLQKNAIENMERQKLQEMSVLYGSALPMRYVMERTMLAQVQRPGGYGSSMHGLNMHMGRYEELDFFDILNDPDQCPDLDRETIHARMEKVYGMTQ